MLACRRTLSAQRTAEKGMPGQGGAPVNSGWIPPCMQVSEAPRDQASRVRRAISA